MSQQKDKKQNDAELRQEVLEDDEKRDLGICIAVTVAVSAALCGILGTCAVIALRALARYRPDIGGYWMSTLPFVFPGITGVAAGFKRERGPLYIHAAVLIPGLLAGGSCFGYSVEPVYFEHSNCTDIYGVGDCEKDVFLYLYLICGASAIGFGLFGLLFAFCACSSAGKRVARRREDEERRQYLEVEKHRQEQLHQKRFAQSSIVTASEKAPIGNDVITPAPNGMSVSTVSGDMNKPAPNAVDTTRL